jgi:hypothetical protein
MFATLLSLLEKFNHKRCQFPVFSKFFCGFVLNIEFCSIPHAIIKITDYHCYFSKMPRLEAISPSGIHITPELTGCASTQCLQYRVKPHNYPAGKIIVALCPRNATANDCIAID